MYAKQYDGLTLKTFKIRGQGPGYEYEIVVLPLQALENYVAVPGLNGPKLNQFPFSNFSVLATNTD